LGQKYGNRVFQLRARDDGVFAQAN